MGHNFNILQNIDYITNENVSIQSKGIYILCKYIQQIKVH